MGGVNEVRSSSLRSGAIAQKLLTPFPLFPLLSQQINFVNRAVLGSVLRQAQQQGGICSFMFNLLI